VSSEISRLIPVVGDAAIASPVQSDGRFVPLVIVDGSHEPRVDLLIAAHEHATDEGHALSIWGYPRGDSTKMALMLRFVRPMEISFAIEFDLIERALLVNSIMNAGLLYIQSGSVGTRYSHNPDAPKILVDVSSIRDDRKWDKVLRTAVRKKMRTLGLNRRDAKEGASNTIKEWQKLMDYRLPS
jgi:hypothetical protein